MISSTLQGAEILDDFGWEATLSPSGSPTGLCVPANVDNFLSVSGSVVYYHSVSISSFKLPPWVPKTFDGEDRLVPPTEKTEMEVMTAIQNMANSVIQNAASRSLAKYVYPYIVKLSMPIDVLCVG